MIDKTLMTLNGNVLTVQSPFAEELFEYAMLSRFKQFTIVQENDVWCMSAPLALDKQKEHAWLFHKMEGIAKKKAKEAKKGPEDDGPDGDGTPPSGGTPGTPVLDKYTVTEARAA